MGGKIIPRIRLTSAKDLVEVEAELGKNLICEWGLFYGHMELYTRPKKQQTYFGGRYGPLTNCQD